MRHDKSDKIILKGIKLFAHHGVTKEEQERGNEYLIDIEFTSNFKQAVAKDSLETTVDYGAVYQLIKKITCERRFVLLETLGSTLSDEILKKFPIEAVKVRIQKLKPPLEGEIAAAGVEIARSKRKLPLGGFKIAFDILRGFLKLFTK